VGECATHDQGRIGVEITLPPADFVAVLIRLILDSFRVPGAAQNLAELRLYWSRKTSSALTGSNHLGLDQAGLRTYACRSYILPYDSPRPRSGPEMESGLFANRKLCDARIFVNHTEEYICVGATYMCRSMWFEADSYRTCSRPYIG
jgi:hypothetical protein